MYNKKYYLDKIEEFHGHNPLYDNLEGKICYLAYLNIGESGWYLCEDNDWFSTVHKIRTSTIQNVEYTRGNQVIVTTRNTKLTFTLVTNN